MATCTKGCSRWPSSYWRGRGRCCVSCCTSRAPTPSGSTSTSMDLRRRWILCLRSLPRQPCFFFNSGNVGAGVDAGEIWLGTVAPQGSRCGCTRGSSTESASWMSSSRSLSGG